MLSGIAVLMTVGVYGFVAGIVKLDDLGLWLSRRDSGAAQALGRGILRAAPWLMKALSVAGTAAMFLVGGGILVHGRAGAAPRRRARPCRAVVRRHRRWCRCWPTRVVGVLAGGLVLAAVSLVQRLRRRT